MKLNWELVFSQKKTKGDIFNETIRTIQLISILYVIILENLKLRIEKQN